MSAKNHSLPVEAPHAWEIFSIRQLAAYLMVSEKTIYRMMEKRQIPGVRVGSQWRFRRHDIEAWLSEQVREVEHGRKRGVVDELDAPQEIDVVPFIDVENIRVRLPAAPKDELIASIIRDAALDPHVDRAQLAASILQRESVCSTALLPAVAFPHPVVSEEFRFTKKRLLVATLDAPVDFGDPHGHHPWIVCVILACSLRGHLFALSRALKLFGDGELQERLRASASREDVLMNLAAFERQLTTTASPTP
ncbi:MAG TPA: PTS sugar transporter subunit IIA [Thermoanaerobaculia bacterium]|nr:PTS sugar transporter subunit IIA [Thermoanaerobaculia bacterium]